MKPRRFSLVALLLSVLVLSVSVASGLNAPSQAASKTRIKRKAAAVSSRWVMAYHVGYQSELWPADRIDFSSMTHFVVGRVKPRWDGSVALDFDIDDVKGPLFAADMAARARNAKRIPILMIGGAGEHDAFAGALSAPNRDRFVNELFTLMDRWGYAGFELDFEPIQPEDEPALEWLVAELRKRRPKVVLTLPVGWINTNFPTIPPFYARIAKGVDQLNVMTYGMSGPWGWPTWHSSPLTGQSPQTPTSIVSSVDAYIKAGVPASKIGVGIGFYGQCWTKRTGPRQDVADATLVAEDSLMSSAIIAAEYAPSMTRTWDAEAQVPYLASGAPVGQKGCQYISYEDAQSVAAKGAWLRKKGLGGVIVWTAGQGYVASTGKNPMLSATWTAVKG
jgi:chitinase